MSERYSKLFALPQNLYSECAPVLIAAGALLKDNETGKVLAQLKIQNIQNNTTKAATVKIVPLDTVGKPLGNEVEHQYLDLNATRDMDFGQKSPILLPDPATRAFSVSIAEVIFTDNSIWTATETREEALATPAPLKQAFGDRELARQYKIEYGANCKYLYKKEKDLWWCACGALNHQDEPLCHSCQKKAAHLAALDLERLKTERDARLKAEQKKAAAKVRTKKATKIAMIAAPIIVVAIAAGMLISDNIQKNSAYGDAMELMDAGNYEEAITAFESLGNYKDSEEQCEIATAKRYPAKALCDFIREKGTHEEQISLPIDNRFILRYNKHTIDCKGDVFMATTNMNIRTDTEVKAAAEHLFNELGLNMTTAVNMFLRQAIRTGGIPFEVKVNTPNEITAAASAEGKRMMQDQTAKGYHSMDALKEALDA